MKAPVSFYGYWKLDAFGIVGDAGAVSVVVFKFGIGLAGVAQFVGQFAEPGDPEYEPPVTKGETKVRALSGASPYSGMLAGTCTHFTVFMVPGLSLYSFGWK